MASKMLTQTPKFHYTARAPRGNCSAEGLDFRPSSMRLPHALAILGAVEARAIALLAVVTAALFLGACLLVVSTTGLSGGAAPEGGPAALGDGSVDANANSEAGLDAVAPAPPSGYPALVLADTPVSYWRFEETTGSIAHDELHAHDAAYVPDNAGGAGIVGSRGANLERARGGRIETNSAAFQFADNHPFAVECWLNLRSVTAFDRIASTEQAASASPTGWFFTYSEGPGPYFSFRKADGTFIEELQGTTAISAGNFHHLAVSHDGRTATMWLDGAAIGSATWSGATAAIGLLTWGCAAGPGNCLDGVLDEAAVYDHALAAERVQAHYAAGKP
jgi:hypothetical protein